MIAAVRKSMMVIAGQCSGDYLGGMASVVLRILALMALVLMPLGMISMSASATTMNEVAAARVADHCAEHQMPASAPSEAQMHCSACAALPAAAATTRLTELITTAPVHIRCTHFVPAFEPEIGTPPPRRS
jgi:hypothetical protein